MVFIVASGLIAAFNVRSEVFPEITLDRIMIEVPYLGAAPEEVEEAMNNPNSPNYEKYLKIRKLNLHKMEPIPVCKIPK